MVLNIRGKVSFICLLAVSLNLISLTATAENDIPAASKFAQSSAKLSFLYCYSCGYKRAFEDYVNIISEKYPHIQTQGANYDGNPLYYWIGQGIFAMKVLVILAVFKKFDVLELFGTRTPGWEVIVNHRMYSCMMIFFVGNMFEQALLTSGAFEISLNGVPIWSKLETGRIPAVNELFQIIDSQLNLQYSDIQNPDFVK